MATQVIFCAQCIADQPHELVVDANHEIVATCPQGHFIKFPAPKDADQLKAWIAEHKKHNEPRMKQAKTYAERRKQIEDILASIK